MLLLLFLVLFFGIGEFGVWFSFFCDGRMVVSSFWVNVVSCLYLLVMREIEVEIERDWFFVVFF